MKRMLSALLAFATAACTVLSGVDQLELRNGPRPPEPAPVDGGAPLDAADADAGADATPDSGTPASTCRTAAECQDERCRADLPDPRIDEQVGSVLGVAATCKGGTPYIISPGASHYYGCDVRCTLAPQPTSTAISTFATYMADDGWYGFKVVVEGSVYVVTGQSTTALCSTY